MIYKYIDTSGKKFKLLLSLHKTYAKMSRCVCYKHITNKCNTCISNFPTIGLHFSYLRFFHNELYPDTSIVGASVIGHLST